MNKQIQFTNKIDEKGRFMGLEAQLVPVSRPIMDRWHLSYLGARNMMQNTNENMGLNKSITKYLLDSFGYAQGLKRK